jgi:predicted metal-dependent peptidase
MKFSGVLGVSTNPEIGKIVQKAQDKLSSIFTELSLGYDNKTLGSQLGGDNLVFQLVFPLKHYCDINALQLNEYEKIWEDFDKQVKAGTMKKEDVPEMSKEEKAFRKSLGKRGALTTAATDGLRYFWNPEFVNKLSRVGLRFVIAHEAWHAIFMHPTRRGSRLPGLWNIAVDYRVNYTVMDDLKCREIRDYEKLFTKELGEYITLDEYSQFLKDPFNPPPRLAHFNPMESMKAAANPGYKHPGDDKPPMYYADAALPPDMKRPENVYSHLLSMIPKCPKCGKMGMYKKPDEYKKLEKQVKEKRKAEAEAAKKEAEEKAKNEKGEGDQDMPGMPGQEAGGSNPGEGKEKGKEKGGKGKGEQGEQPGHCCGGEGHEHGKEEGQGKGSGKGEKSDQEGQEGSGQGKGEGQEPGEGGEGHSCGEQPDGSCGDQPGESCGDGSCGDEEGQGCGTDGKCDECGDGEYVNPIIGDLMDEHMDSDVSEEEMAKRVSEAIDNARKMAGRIPGGLTDELNELVAPTITWQDIVRNIIRKKREGYGKNDWNRPKSRPLFTGQWNPKKRDYFINFIAIYDCSGSMSGDDISFGLSQLQVIDEKGEGVLLPFDSSYYPNEAVKIKKAKTEDIKKAKVHGRGGTEISLTLNHYEDDFGEQDIAIIITDGYLADTELKSTKFNKKTEYVWLITSHNPSFKPPVGRVFHLRNEKL